jgi:phosphatidate phosphatase LPIN
VRFGRSKVFVPRDKRVSLTVNDKKKDLYMKLGTAGEAFFVEETDTPVDDADYLTSPILVRNAAR